jgi:hypothetical protein
MFIEGSKEAVEEFMKQRVFCGNKQETKIIKIDASKITRITFIGKNGREFEKMFDSADLMLQDQGKTLKIFSMD